ncbi:hypothetical protein Tco_0918018 [Tanacetum coccineum]
MLAPLVFKAVLGGNDQPAFVSVGVSAETAHTAAEGPAAPSWLKGMVLHRDGNIKLFSRELDRVSKEIREF